MPPLLLVWLRADLRIADNPALAAAGARGGNIVAVAIDETAPGLRPIGAASRWWRERSLAILATALAARGIRLETGHASLLDAARRHRPRAVLWNRRYAPAERAEDERIERALAAMGIPTKSFAGNVLVEPFEITTGAGTPYAVYTPFWNALRERHIPQPLPAPPAAAALAPPSPPPTARPAGWTTKLASHWQIGEAAARQKLSDFFDHLAAYPDGRDVPARPDTSRLSPHLAHGEISARQIWHATTALAHRRPELSAAAQKFLMELAWRDFHIHQLYHRPDIATVPMQRRFENLRWRDAPGDLRAWQRGETGIAIVDAGMRELWETGFMHNRVRMLAASLLTKNLLIDWRCGERWFWDCLVDADPASNPGNWQWVAGCGNDAAPYFRIFNPDLQAKKFDPDGAYVRRWAPTPRPPIVDLKASRERALAAFRAL